MVGLSELVVLVALGATALLGLVVAWVVFRRTVSLVWRAVGLLLMVGVLLAGALSAYVAYGLLVGKPIF